MGVTTGHVVCRVRNALSVYINFYNNNLFKHFSMKKFFLFCMIALVGMCGLNSCSDDCNHEYIEHDYSKELVGTWTCLKADFAEALVFKADGTFASVGVANGEYWEYPNATWTLKGNKLALSSVDNKSNVRLEIIPGNSLALVDEKGNEYRDPFEIGKELRGYLDCRPPVPNGINKDGINVIRCLKKA
jgi:hypothetical protein